MVEDKELRQKYDRALDQFIDRVKQDSSILAVYVLGSYVNGTLWERSDIDMVIVTNDESSSGKFLALEENSVSINAFTYSRSDFRRNQQRFIHGSIFHHLLSSSKLIYSTDKAISEFNRDMSSIAERDKDLQLMLSAEFLVGGLHKAQKTLYVEKSREKCFRWLFQISEQLARIVILMNNQIPGRDVLAQLKEIDSKIYSATSLKIITDGFSEQNIEYFLEYIENFLLEHKNRLYKPLFEYLKEVSERTVSEIDNHFAKALGTFGSSNFLTFVESYEWLAHHGDIMKGISPRRITAKSRITVDETLLYYIGGNAI